MRLTRRKSLPRIDNHYALLVLSFLFIAYALCASVMTAVMIKPLRADLDLSLLDIAWLTTAYFNTYIIAQFPLGILIDRIGAIKVIRISVAIAIVSFIWFAYADSFHSAAWARAFTGLAMSPAIASSLYIAAHAFSPTYFVLIVGIAEAIAMLSAALSESLFIHVINSVGWRTAVLYLAVAGVVLLVLLFIVKADKPARDLEQTTDYKHFDFKAVMRAVFSSHVIMNGVVSGLVFSLMLSFAGLWCIPFLEQSYAISNEQAAFYSSLALMGAAMSMPILGYAVRSVEKQYLYLLIGAVLCNVLSIVLISRVIKIEFVPFLLLLLGIASCVYVIPFSLVKHNCPKNIAGTLMAVVNLLCGAVGTMLLVPVVAYLVEGEFGPKFTVSQAVWLFPMSLTFSIIIIILFRAHLIGPKNPDIEQAAS